MTRDTRRVCYGAMATPWSRYSSSLGANELIFWSGDRDAEFNCDPILGGEAQEESLNDIYGVSDIDHGNAFDVCETEYGMSRRPSAYVDLFESTFFHVPILI